MKKSLLLISFATLLASCSRQLDDIKYTLHLNQNLGPFTMGSEGERCQRFEDLIVWDNSKGTLTSSEPKGSPVSYEIKAGKFSGAGGVSSVGCNPLASTNGIRVEFTGIKNNDNIYVFYIDKPLTAEQESFAKLNALIWSPGEKKTPYLLILRP